MEDNNVYVSWGSYHMGFGGCTMEQAVKQFADRVPITEQVEVNAYYGWQKGITQSATCVVVIESRRTQ